MIKDDGKDIWKKLYSTPTGVDIPYTVKRRNENLLQITNLQEEYFEAIVEDSEYKDAIEVINHIKGLA